MAKQKKKAKKQTKVKRERPAMIASLVMLEVSLKRRAKIEAYLNQMSLSKLVNDALRNYLSPEQE